MKTSTILPYDFEDLKLENYQYELDSSFIAKRPVSPRHNSKLLIYNQSKDEITHDTFLNLANYLPEDSTITFNQSKVFNARLIGNKPTGGKCEVFILSLDATNEAYECMVKTSGKKNINDEFLFQDNLKAKILDRLINGNFLIKFNLNIDKVLEQALLPIPPYIRNGLSDSKDLSDYQTNYAKDLGSVAAPTAGLHFTNEVFQNLENKNIKKAFVTLHVGQGTFAPVKSDTISEHNMHFEKFTIDHENYELIKNSNKIFAVGTTSLRVLESIYDKDFTPNKFESTNIFLHPGKTVKSVSGLITNFHLPGSSLIMLVSAIIGRKKTLEIYEIAKKNNYRFFSYGDAMLIVR